MKRKNYFLLFMVVLVYFFIFAPLILYHRKLHQLSAGGVQLEVV